MPTKPADPSCKASKNGALNSMIPNLNDNTMQQTLAGFSYPPHNQFLFIPM